MINRLNIRFVLLIVLVVFEASTTVYAQAELWHKASVELKGAIDVHVHGAPDSGPRSLDVLEMARIARRYGMRALLFKNHHTHTASLAYLVNQTIPGIDVYGGIVLNRSVGGINPIAVEHMAVTTGGLGRVVWMPTWDSEHYTRTLKPNPQFVSISHDGQLLPEVKEVLTLMARMDLSLATGHSSPDESLLLIREAKALGVDRIIVTHPMAPAVGMTLEQQKEAARLGAFLEYCFNPLLPADTGKAKPDGGLPIETMVNSIRAVGTEHAIISTDLGQELNPIPTDGMISFFLMLSANGFTQKEIEQMSKTNPAKFLGLQQLHQVSPATVEDATATDSSEVPAPTSEEGFGKSNNVVRQPSQSSSKPQRAELIADILKISKRPYGEMIMTLDNGQVWVEKRPTRNFRVKVGDTVTIRQGRFGGYRLFGSSNQSTEVTRIR